MPFTNAKMLAGINYSFQMNRIEQKIGYLVLDGKKILILIYSVLFTLGFSLHVKELAFL